MADDILFQLTLAGFGILLLFILMNKSYFALQIMRLKNRNIGHIIRIWHKDTTFTDFMVPNVRTFDWKNKWYKKLFNDIPEWLEQVKIPDTPYARDRRTGFPLYEFNEDSKECINPYERQPDLYMYSQDHNDLVNAFELGRKWERQGGGNQNRILLILMILNLVVGAIGLGLFNQQAETMTKFQKDIAPLIEKANQIAADYEAGKLNVKPATSPPPSNVPGQVGQVS